MSSDFKAVMVVLGVIILIILSGGISKHYGTELPFLLIAFIIILIGHIIIFRDHLQNPSTDTSWNKVAYVVVSLALAGMVGFGSFMILAFVFLTLYPPNEM